MDSEILWRVAIVQAAAVAALSLLLALLLPQSFFASWGWRSGPLAWLLCARLTAWVVGRRADAARPPQALKAPQRAGGTWDRAEG